MRLTFLGAAGEVTGSMIRLDVESGSILIDCGMFQGRRAESRRRNRDLPRAATSCDAAILTHAHVDHSGNLPTLVKSGFRGTIHATPATYDLCAFMLRDAARIQEADAEYLNRKGRDDPDHQEIIPLYDEEDALRALERFVAVPYHRLFDPLPGVREDRRVTRGGCAREVAIAAARLGAPPLEHPAVDQDRARLDVEPAHGSGDLSGGSQERDAHGR